MYELLKIFTVRKITEESLQNLQEVDSISMTTFTNTNTAKAQLKYKQAENYKQRIKTKYR